MANNPHIWNYMKGKSIDKLLAPDKITSVVHFCKDEFT